jgi:hypothetical protein
MAVTLLRAYGGYPAGQVAQFEKSTEDSLVAQRLATAGGTITTGAATANQNQGRASIAAGQSSVVITNNLVNTSSVIECTLAQGTADTTLTSIVRVVPSAGSFQAFGNANATAAVIFDWKLLNPLT